MPLSARDARAGDYETFARLFPELDVPDPTPTAAQFEARIRPHSFLLWDDARPVAYAFWYAVGDVCRVNHVVVAPEHQGRGVGQELLRELGARARGAGCVRWQLSVRPENARAIRLYERFGMREAARATALEIDWKDVAGIPIEAGYEPFVVAEGDEARVERALALLDGKIGALRKDGHWVFPAIRRGEEVVAFAAFDPAFPGGRYFEAARPALARALLEAMRPYALPELSFVRLVVPQGEVERALAGAGAKVVLRMLEMRGAIDGGR